MDDLQNVLNESFYRAKEGAARRGAPTVGEWKQAMSVLKGVSQERRDLLFGVYRRVTREVESGSRGGIPFRQFVNLMRKRAREPRP